MADKMRQALIRKQKAGKSKQGEKKGAEQARKSGLRERRGHAPPDLPWKNSVNHQQDGKDKSGHIAGI